jgi:EAL domain-containing protein (putative c-di-GMP-specific phosphodiesterase class I)
MLAAKDSGKNRYHFFDSENDRKAKHQHTYLLNLKVAFKNQEFVLYYQPKVNLISGRVIGAEALIRWNSSADGLISPAEFLPHVYGTELEIPLGEWVIQSAVQQAALWQQAGLDMTVSVNVSAHQLLKPDFVETLVRALGHFPSFPSSHLELEILETAAIADIDQAVLVINKCRAIGVQFALDDFGTGYSSLTYLRKLPVQTLKIDQSFVRNMLRSEDDMGIVESVIRLGGTFGRQIIAEGVETMAHGSELLRMGCPLAQGFGIARPMPGEQLIPWMHEWNSASAWTGLQTGDFVI